ncbi:MAG: radical SAM family heme chaperone HemW, partial [Betaproteobacteria bacterium]
MAAADIAAALATGVPHLSAYQLTIEPNTVFWRERPELPPHDRCADMQAMVEDHLAAAGFEHYETSAFAKPGRRCLHNLNYWEFGDYLGVGAGAHGKVSFPDRVTRHERAKQPVEYLKGAAMKESAVSFKELPFEFMLNALRLIDGFPVELFQQRTGLPPASIREPLRAAEQGSLLEVDWKRVKPTAKGRLFLNDLLQFFLPERG